VNVAGINILGKIENIDETAASNMCQTNLLAPLWLIRGVVDGMRRRGGGRIVNFSSIWGVRSKEYRTLYSMTKFGLTGMTKALARELGPDGILINAVAPGYVNTEMTRENVPPAEQVRLCAEIPLRRMAEPSEIAKLVRFLISVENSYITGQSIVIDGGFLA
jgi:3-oxoacyl-[acyl-carrier protein] reductase